MMGGVGEEGRFFPDSDHECQHDSRSDERIFYQVLIWT